MRKLVLVNAFSLNMLPDIAEVTLRFKVLSHDLVRQLVKELPLVSYIGHQDLANVLSDILGVEVPVNRGNYVFSGDYGDYLVVAQYRGPRLPEGATTLPEGAKIVFYAVEKEV